MTVFPVPAPIRVSIDTRWWTSTQNAAIFACCANLFSTALANVGFVAFLLLFARCCFGPERRLLASENFPKGVAAALVLYLGWQVIGIFYTEASLGYALKNIYADRKILYVLPLTLLFAQAAPRRRFLIAFLACCAVALVISFCLSLPGVGLHTRIGPTQVFRSHATQGLAFAMAAFVALWLGTQAQTLRNRVLLFGLSAGFALNIMLVTTGRSGYLAFLVFLVVAFVARYGSKGLVFGFAAAGLTAVLAFSGVSSVHDRVLLGVNEARQYLGSPDETPLGRRMLMYEVTAELVRERPVLGGGTGSFKDRFSSIVASRYPAHDWKARPFDDPHNQYLFSLVENGIFGLATFLFLLYMLYRHCDKNSAFGQMAAACLLAWCATSLFSGHFRTFPEGHLIAFVLGILMPPVRPQVAPHPAAEAIA